MNDQILCDYWCVREHHELHCIHSLTLLLCLQICVGLGYFGWHYPLWSVSWFIFTVSLSGLTWAACWLHFWWPSPVLSVCCCFRRSVSLWFVDTYKRSGSNIFALQQGHWHVASVCNPPNQNESLWLIFPELGFAIIKKNDLSFPMTSKDCATLPTRWEGKLQNKP